MERQETYMFMNARFYDISSVGLVSFFVLDCLGAAVDHWRTALVVHIAALGLF